MAILACEYYSTARKSFQSFNVVLPIDCPPDTTGAARYVGGPYQTIYLLHGYSGSRNDWLRNSPIESWARQQGYAVIMPDGANSFYLDNEDTGERFGAYVGQELVDVTRLMFPLSPAREDTVIAGLSMGGFGALLNGFRYADSFGAVIALSPALITDEVAGMKPGGGTFMAPYGYYRHTFGEPEALPGSDKDPKRLAKSCLERGDAPRVFLACGREDFLFPHSRDFHAYLASNAYPHAWWTRAGGHDFDFWNRAMPAAMEWLAGG